VPHLTIAEALYYRGQPVRRLIEFCLALVALMLLAYAHAQPADQARPTDDSLRLYAVDIWQDPPQSWGPGRGVLGKGLVITAAHVVTPVAHTKPHVRIVGMPARKGYQGGRFQPRGSDTFVHRRAEIAHLSADAPHAALRQQAVAGGTRHRRDSRRIGALTLCCPRCFPPITKRDFPR
jgi:hypothetical protein